MRCGSLRAAGAGEHRNAQAGLLLATIIATLLLEGSIRFGDGAAAFAQSAYYGTPTMYWVFAVHLAVAAPTFITWCVLAVLSWRRFSLVLPGRFSSTHRRWGQVTYVGLWLTCFTGVGLYVMSYAL